MDKYKVLINKFGGLRWWLNGLRHRDDGPAVKNADGSKCWYLNGKPYRLYGPASVYPNGNKYWYIHGKELSEKQRRVIKLD